MSIEGEVVDAGSETGLALASDGVSLRREPEVVLAEAVKAATALKKVLDGKPDKVMMNGEQYIENDDWQTIAHFYGISARVVEEQTRPVQFGDVFGFEAVAEAVTRDGRIVGRAKAMCLNDEEKWSDRPKYEWQIVLKTGEVVSEDVAQGLGHDAWQWEAKDASRPVGKGNARPVKRRVQVGLVKVPTFQLLSMAQTRASSKVLRMVLGFVPVLAGFKATPAEELDGHTERVPNEKAAAPKPAQAARAQSASPLPARVPTTDELRREEDEHVQGASGALLHVTDVKRETKTYSPTHKKAGETFLKYTATFSDGRVAETVFDRWGNIACDAAEGGWPVTLKVSAKTFRGQETLEIVNIARADATEHEPA